MKRSKAIFRQYIATFSCLLCSMMTAITFVWYTPLMVGLLDENDKSKEGLNEIQGINSDQLSWLIAIIEVGELLGPIPCGYIADRWGRKPCLLITFPLVLSSWLVTFLTRSLTWLYVARIIQGAAIGIFFTIGPVYVAEIAEPDIRGALGGQLQIMWFAGVVFSYSTGPFLSYQNYIIVSSLPTFLFLACFLLAPETPYFYMMVNKRKEAEESLKWLRGDVDVQTELKSVEDTCISSGDGSGWKDLFFSKTCRKPLGIITLICFVKYFAGTTTITSFSTQTFSKSVDDPRDADFISIAMALILIITTICATWCSDSLGRRPLAIFSTLGLFFSTSILSVYYYLERETIVDVSRYSWVSFAGIAVYCITFNLGLGPVQTIIQAEYFPSHVRAAAGGYATILTNIICFISIKQYQLLDDYVGVYSNFVLFAIVALIGLILLIAFMEETAKKSLGEIQIKNETSICSY